MTPVERVRELATRIASARGLDIFDVELKREGGQLVLRVIVDRPGPAATAEESVSIEDCARVAEELGTVLDVEDVMPGEYTFEVSSPGLDRPLRTADDYCASHEDPQSCLTVGQEEPMPDEDVVPNVFVTGKARIRLRYVLKKELLADPIMDIAGNRDSLACNAGSATANSASLCPSTYSSSCGR